ncbi:hypothetical protein [uncultured Varibaculum sp.]|uniref:hypothetical protein n=1 Tax=uncultured Varibaculum sp. TaxID=413896 RepID=UPI002599B535|nr:hypothetical protein [uncultured Varibaculum sp.]
MAVLKPATIIDQQIEILRERGMTLDESLARQFSALFGLIPKICVFFRACWGGLVACPAFADV